VLRSIFGKLSRSQKQSNMTKYSSKLSQGPTGSQHSPVTHPELLKSDPFCFKFLELGLSYFDLLQCDNLLHSKFVDYCAIEQSFQALFCSDDNLFEFISLSFKFSGQLACFFLDWLNSLGDFHKFTLQCMYLLLGCALFLEPLHSFD
jgi:hypothetical protein